MSWRPERIANCSVRRVRSRQSLFLSIALCVFVGARGVSAQQILRFETFPLGAGMSVDRLHIRWGRGSYATWRANGFSLGPAPVVNALSFSGAQGGRVVAIVHGGAYFTDDRGANWQPASWDGAASAAAISFDAASAFGVAGGEDGTIWTTEDRGEHWRRRREREQELVTAVATMGTAFAFVTLVGSVSISRDGGQSFETVFESSGRSDVFLRRTDDTLDVIAGSTLLGRLGRDGSYTRVSIAPP